VGASVGASVGAAVAGGSVGGMTGVSAGPQADKINTAHRRLPTRNLNLAFMVFSSIVMYFIR
jgi:hypothetical protein